MTSKDTTKTLPLLPLRDIVVFPHMMVPLYVGRPSSIAAVEEVVNGDGDFVLAAQKEARTNSPKRTTFFHDRNCRKSHAAYQTPGMAP